MSQGKNNHFARDYEAGILMKNYDNTKFSTGKSDLLRDVAGGSSVKFSLIISAVAIAVGLAVPIAIEGNSQILAFDRPDIDYMTTSSIKPVKRYNIRKSVLDNNQANPFPE
ncbi:MAG: hypothetical protein L3J32_03935 [Rhizobiaceae bacterium]|nr:hypothetical protein [Rhizobiaceae bacterium]